MRRRELQHGVLARREFKRLGRAQAQALDVMGHVIDCRDGSLEDARRMMDDLVRFGNLDRAIFRQYARASEHVLSFTGISDFCLAAGLHHAALYKLAPASAAAT